MNRRQDGRPWKMPHLHAIAPAIRLHKEPDRASLLTAGHPARKPTESKPSGLGPVGFSRG